MTYWYYDLFNLEEEGREMCSYFFNNEVAYWLNYSWCDVSAFRCLHININSKLYYL